MLGEAMACGAPCVMTDVGDSAQNGGGKGRVVTVDDMSGLAGKVLELWALSDGERSKLSERTRSKTLRTTDANKKKSTLVAKNRPKNRTFAPAIFI